MLDNPSIPDFEYLFENYENWTQEKLNNNVNLFKQMQDILQRLGEPKNFPLYGCEVREIDLEILLKLKNELKNFLKNFNDIYAITLCVLTSTQKSDSFAFSAYRYRF